MIACAPVPTRNILFRVWTGAQARPMTEVPWTYVRVFLSSLANRKLACCANVSSNHLKLRDRHLYLRRSLYLRPFNSMYFLVENYSLPKRYNEIPLWELSWTRINHIHVTFVLVFVHRLAMRDSSPSSQ
jgi:hypothetical protein